MVASGRKQRDAKIHLVNDQTGAPQKLFKTVSLFVRIRDIPVGLARGHSEALPHGTIRIHGSLDARKQMQRDHGDAIIDRPSGEACIPCKRAMHSGVGDEYTEHIVMRRGRDGANLIRRIKVLLIDDSAGVAEIGLCVLQNF